MSTTVSSRRASISRTLPWIASAALCWLPSLPAAENETHTEPPVQVQIDWSAAVRKTTPFGYGLNAFAGFDAAVQADPLYRRNMAFMRPGLLRLHSWNMLDDAAKRPDGWVNIAEKNWDRARIAKTLSAYPAEGTALLINIPGWPAWMKSHDDMLDESEYGAYAAFCANLVRIVNVEQKCHVKYWEITNERDDAYWVKQNRAGQPENIDALAKIYNRCAVTMKAVDPSIETGGPAAARSDFIPQLRKFVVATRQNLDFFSGHAYGSGSADDSDASIFTRPKAFGGVVRDLVAMLKEESPDRPIPLHINEYNISWTWETHDKRMLNYKGAAFDALAMVEMLNNGAAATNAWNERDGIYGKMSPDGKLRPSAEVFHWLNSYFTGTVAQSTSSAPKAVTVFAVAADKVAGEKVGDSRAWLLINHSAAKQTVRVVFNGRTDTATSKTALFDCFQIDAEGARAVQTDASALAAGTVLYPYTVSCYVLSGR